MLEPIWIWAILGVILLGVEMLTGTFYILWFGFAALCLALLMFLMPSTSTAMQLLAFSVLSVTSLGVWKLKYSDTPPKLRVGQSHSEAIGAVGNLLEPVSPQQLGRIGFTLPVMGSRQWVVASDEAIMPGEQAEVIGIEGNYLKVRSVK